MRIKETRIKKMLRECRFSLNLTISDLAFMIDVSDRTVLRWIAEESIPSYHHRMRIYEIYALLDGPRTHQEQIDISERIAEQLERKERRPIKTHMSTYLRELKDHLGITQVRLGNHLGYSEQAIYKWINGHNIPRSAAAEIILIALKKGLPTPPSDQQFWELYEQDLKDRSERSKALRLSNAAK